MTVLKKKIGRPPGSKKLQCKLCASHFFNVQYFNEHLSKVHTKNKNVVAPVFREASIPLKKTSPNAAGVVRALRRDGLVAGIVMPAQVKKRVAKKGKDEGVREPAEDDEETAVDPASSSSASVVSVTDSDN